MRLDVPRNRLADVFGRKRTAFAYQFGEGSLGGGPVVAVYGDRCAEIGLLSGVPVREP